MINKISLKSFKQNYWFYYLRFKFILNNLSIHWVKIDENNKIPITGLDKIYKKINYIIFV